MREREGEREREREREREMTENERERIWKKRINLHEEKIKKQYVRMKGDRNDNFDRK